MKTGLRGLSAAIAICAAGASLAATPDSTVPSNHSFEMVAPQIWRVDGGDLRMRFNESFLEGFGVGVELSAGVRDRKHSDFAVFPVLSSGGLRFNAPDGGFDRFIDGQLRVQGGFELTLPGGQRIDLRNPEIKADPENPLRLRLLGADGQAWVYVDHLMYDFSNQQRTFRMRAADLRASPQLAKRVGIPELADAYIGEIHFEALVRDRGADTPLQSKGSSVPRFHGEAHPSGGTYQADVLMEAYSMSFSRCRNSTATGGCDGAGADDGQVVFTPSATLRNSDTDRTADIPWYEKFTGASNPYGYPYPNADQHPYLIWNLYRIVDDQLEQIAGSGVKHAWLTINTGCASGAFFNPHILGRRCGDTYGTGNNDDPTDLGPRSELLPATGQWGRCGSVFDPNCVGSSTVNNPNGSYGSRMIVRESQMQVTGAQFLTDAWYVVQDDINIYNTMGRRSITLTPGGGGWATGGQSAMVQGPALNAWVDPVTNPQRNVELRSEFGRARVAVKVKTLDACPPGSGLGGTCYRYDYAVNNFDFTTATTQGTPPNLQVIGARGFNRFTLQRPAGSGIFLPENAHFADIDINPANNWTAVVNSNSVEWTAPVGNELNWGTLFRFTVISDAEPSSEAQTTVSLQAANSVPVVSPPTSTIVGPIPFGGRIMVDGFEAN